MRVSLRCRSLHAGTAVRAQTPPDDVLFGITRCGVAPPFGPPGYESDMPGFGAVLSDSQIRDVLAYIKSRWSPRSRDAQRKIDEERRR